MWNMDWIYLALCRRALVKAVMNPSGSIKSGNFLITLECEC